MGNEMDEIIENLYLGGYGAAQDIQQLKEKGIKKVLSVMELSASPTFNSNEFKQLKFDINDIETQNIIHIYGECLKFIKGDDKILVHCMAGASRSATIVIAYLMWTKKWKFDEAFNFVKSKRQIVYPNDGFQSQLKLFEKLLIENDYNIDKINFKEIDWKPPENLI